MFRRNLSGLKSGKITVTTYDGFRVMPCGQRAHYWNGVCECGKPVVVASANLISSNVKSCGCLNVGAGPFKHGLTRKNHIHPLFSIWNNMIRRCTNPKRPFYKDYGGRGIKVCKRWRKFVNFVHDMFPTWSLGLTIERVNNNGNYEPINCVWIPRGEQQLNTRRSRFFEFDGRRLPVALIAKECKMPYDRLWQRLILYKWPIALAVSAPPYFRYNV